MGQFNSIVESSRWRPIVLIALAAVLFSVNLGGYDLWPPDEPRFAEVAREMLQSGDYLSPHVNGEPYLEKPPLLFWAIAGASLPFGDVTEWSARIPSVVSALVAVLCTYALASRLFGARVAFWSALVLMTNVRFWWQARAGQIDMLLTACLSVSLLSFHVWHETRRKRWLVAFYGAQAAAVYAKGPVGVILPLLMLFTFYWRERAERRQTHWLLGTLAVAAAVLLWFIPARMAVADTAGQFAQVHMASNLFRQTIGRFFLGVSKAQPPWYYLGTIPVDLLPWTLFLPWTLPWLWKRRKEGPGMRLLLSWTVPTLIFFSICVGKRAIYLLPLFPVFAILVARSVLDLAEGEHVVWRRRTAAVWAFALLLIGLVPFAVRFTQYRDAWSWGLLVFALAALGLAGNLAARTLKSDMRRLHAVIAVHFAVLAVICALFVFPIINQFKSARAFCAPLRALSEARTAYDLYSVGFSREEYVFYAKHFHEPVLTEDLPMDDSLSMSPETWTEAQKGLRAGLSDAVADVPIASFERIGKFEVEALRAAIDAGIKKADVDPALAAAFLNALRKEVRGFAARFDGNKPAFMFIREEDWRSFLPLYETLPRYTVIGHSQIGRRTVLLLANAAAEKGVLTGPR